jgi:hypothetical protein
VEVLRPVLGNRRFSIHNRHPDISQLRVYQSQYDFRQLWELSIRMRDVLLLPGVFMTDINERRNRLLVMVQDATAQARVEAALVQMNVPREAVIFRFGGPVEDFQSTLSSGVFPLEGGLRITYLLPDSVTFASACTLGLNVRQLGTVGVDYFITASHCSNVRGEGADGTSFYQWDATGQFRYRGREVRDPAYFGTGQDSRCPLGRECRFSDATLVQYDSARYSNFGLIAQTTGSNRMQAGSDIISTTNPHFSITDEDWYPIEGEVVEKMGRTTGWTWGGVRGEQPGDTINYTCASISRRRINQPDIIYLCQTYVNSFAQHGDSGAPVFSRVGGNEVYSMGILLGGATDAYGPYWIFSPLSGIYRDLGWNLYTTPDLCWPGTAYC